MRLPTDLYKNISYFIKKTAVPEALRFFIGFC